MTENLSIEQIIIKVDAWPYRYEPELVAEIKRLRMVLAQYGSASGNWRQMFDHGSDPLIVWCGQGAGPQVADEALRG